MNGNRSAESGLYRSSLALLTDLYQLTMACGYWKTGRADDEAVFHLFFRKNPFAGGYAVACGLGPVLDYLERFSFSKDDLSFLAEMKGNDGQPLFVEPFLQYLEATKLSVDVDAIPEGTVVQPHEPLLRVQGPLLQCQILETALLNLINFETLIATKAARVCSAAQGEPVLEFGLRRAQGIDGGLSASRAAYVGGCAATSNVLAGKLFGIPVRGTHAHSWVMAFDDELQAFSAYAAALPNNCVFLVDTYDTLAGVENAITVGRQLRTQGHDLLGVRLDSGDLAYLSIEARKILDRAGFEKTQILASNDLDEQLISSLKEQGAMVGVWGVGTKLVTAADQPALGGVYKLSAIRKKGRPWQHKIKLSEQAIKISTPGIQQVRRFSENGQFRGDAIYDCDSERPKRWAIVDPLDPTRRRTFGDELLGEDLLIPVLRAGRRLGPPPSLPEARARTEKQLSAFHPGIRRFLNPHQYPVGLESSLHEKKTALILKARGGRE